MVEYASQRVGDICPAHVWEGKFHIGELTVRELHEEITRLVAMDPHTGDVCGMTHELFDQPGDCGPMKENRLYCPHAERAQALLRASVGVLIHSKNVTVDEAQAMMSALGEKVSTLKLQDDATQFVGEHINDTILYPNHLQYGMDHLQLTSEQVPARGARKVPIELIEHVRTKQRPCAQTLGAVQQWAAERLATMAGIQTTKFTSFPET